MDVQLVKQQGMRLNNMKYAPKAELTPMRGLRPSGPGTEEGRISLADQDHQTTAGLPSRTIQQDETLEEELNTDQQPRKPSAQSSATVARQAAERSQNIAQKPARMNSGQWPKVRCVACGKLVRIGLGQCQLCGKNLNVCKCGETRGPSEQFRSALSQAVESSCQLFCLSPRQSAEGERSTGQFRIAAGSERRRDGNSSLRSQEANSVSGVGGGVGDRGNGGNLRAQGKKRAAGQGKQAPIASFLQRPPGLPPAERQRASDVCSRTGTDRRHRVLPRVWTRWSPRLLGNSPGEVGHCTAGRSRKR